MGVGVDVGVLRANQFRVFCCNVFSLGFYVSDRNRSLFKMESKRKDSTMCSNLLFCLQYFVDHPRAVSPLVETAKHLSEDVISLPFTRTGIPIVKTFLKNKL